MHFAVLGLGESLIDYKGEEDCSIGVNDIFRHFPVDYLIVHDPPERFSKERREVIRNSKPKKFFTYLEEWEGVHNYEKITLHHYRGQAFYDSDLISYGVMTPLSAMILAYKLGATQITLYGVDLLKHPKFKLDAMTDNFMFNKCVKHLKEFVDKCPVPVHFTPSCPIKGLI